jgi:hypothetical protein
MSNSRQVCASLLKRDILANCRPGVGIRMSPHFYACDDEIHGAFPVCDQIMARVPASISRQ